MVTTLVEQTDFPASEKNTYLNAAGSGLMYSRAAKAVIDWQKVIAENGTGTSAFDARAEEVVFLGLHSAAARLLNTDSENIAVASSATELMSSLAWSIFPPKGRNIVTTRIAHPSTTYPWQRVAEQSGCGVRLVQEDAQGYVNKDALLRSINRQTAVVCLSHLEYRSGQLYDLATFAEKAHTYGALLVVDATQSAGAVPIDVTNWGVDALVSSGYKWLCGPFGAAIMYVSSDLAERLNPGLVGWRSHTDMWDFRADRLELPVSAKRFEFSTMAYGCAIGLARALEFLVGIGVKRILSHNNHLANLLRDGLENRGGEIISPQNPKEHASIIAVRFSTQDASELYQRLRAKKVIVSARGGIIRLSPHLYNDERDIDQFFDVLDDILIE